MLQIMQNHVNLDADQTVFFKRQLEYIERQVYNIEYPPSSAQLVFPVSSEAGPGAESITYEMFDSFGIMKFVSDYADDLPRSDVKGAQYNTLIQSLGGSWGYSVQEIRNASYAGRNLSNMRAMSARQSNDQMVNRIGWFADGTADWAGCLGILYNANTTKTAATNGDWLTTATPDQIIEDVNDMLCTIPEVTKGLYRADTVLMPIRQHCHIATTPRSSDNDTTILTFLQANHPGVTFAGVNELKDVSPIPRTGTGTDDHMIAYVRNPLVMKFHLPVIYEQFPAQERNLSSVVPCHSRVAGITIYRPLTVHLIDGI